MVVKSEYFSFRGPEFGTHVGIEMSMLSFVMGRGRVAVENP